MPSIKDVIDKRYLSELKNNNDDYRLLQYMKEVKSNIDNISEINQLNNHIAKLDNKIKREQGMLNNKGEDVRNAYYTMEAIKNGRAPGTGQLSSGGINYWDKYNQAINNYANKKNNDGSIAEATSVMFSFKNADDYNAFLTTGGYTDDEFYKSGIEISEYNGKKSITIAKNNPKFIEIMDAISNTHIRKIPQFIPENLISGFVGATLPKPFGDIPKFIGANALSYFLNRNLVNKPIPVDVTGIDGNGVLFPTETNKNVGNSDVMSTYYDIKRKLKNLEPEKDELWNTTITTLPYITAGESNMMTKLDRGLINEDDFKKWLSEEHRRVFDLIAGDNLTQYDVYSDSQSDGTFRPISPEDKHDLGRKLINALNKGRVQSVKGAIAGHQTGVYIVIADDTDNEGNPRKEGSYDTGQRLFIKGALSNALEEAFNARSEWRAYKESVEMEHYGYDYTLSTGDRITKNVNSPTGWTYLYKDGIEEVIDMQGIRNKINKDIIMQNATDYLSVINKNENRAKAYEYNLVKPLTTTDESAFKVAVQTVQETMPNITRESPDYWDEVYYIYNELLTNIGYNGSRMFNKKDVENGR